jgi:Cys-rich repeat protein
MFDPRRCKSDGTCACFSGWLGAHCDKPATDTPPPECEMDSDCGSGGVCDSGMCFCAGEQCETCGCGEYGAEQTCGAERTCSIDTTCNGKGRSAASTVTRVYFRTCMHTYTDFTIV